MNSLATTILPLSTLTVVALTFGVDSSPTRQPSTTGEQTLIPSSAHHQNTTVEIAKDVLFVKVLVIMLYCLIAIVGLAGNLLVIVVVARTKSIQTITNIFIANLALSDILMCLVATPFTPVSLYMKNWTLPEVVCKLLPITMGISVYVSTLTSMAIALDRYFVIVHPFLSRMRIWLCLLIILTIWAMSFLISMPLAVYQQKHFVKETGNWACQENWPKESSREVFTIVSFILQFVVPCSIISVCYFNIGRILRMRLQTKVGMSLKNRMQDLNEIKRKRRTNSMLIAMVVIFVICWIPLNTLLIAMDAMSERQSTDFHKSKYFTLAFFICHLLAMSSAVYNPFLYAWMNEGFRTEVYRLFPCFCAKSHRNLDVARNTVQYSVIQLRDHAPLQGAIMVRSANVDFNQEEEKAEPSEEEESAEIVQKADLEN